MRPLKIGPREVVYTNPHQQIYRVVVDFEGFTKEIYVADTGRRAGIVAVRDGRVLLTQQYRLLINEVSWEIPGGKVDDNETPEAAAVRECLEETGVRCLHPHPLLFYHVGLDTAHNPTHVFYSEEVAESPEPHQVHRQEVCGSAWMDLPDCLRMIGEQRIVDGLTIMALLAYDRLKRAAGT